MAPSKARKSAAIVFKPSAKGKRKVALAAEKAAAAAQRCVILSVGRLRRRLRVSPTMVGGDGTTPVVLGRRLADDRCR